MPRFLTELQVLKMHDYLILLYGGELGVLDAAQLDSALNQPKAQFGGKFLHPTIPHYGCGLWFSHLPESCIF